MQDFRGSRPNEAGPDPFFFHQIWVCALGKEKRPLNDVAAIELSLGVVVAKASDLLQAKRHGKAEFERAAKYTPVGRRK